jgi:peptidoglycan/LPS O-acetylase OafA/YrhL
MADTKRLAFIDSLRGLAALYVVIFHISLVPKFKPVIPDFIKPFILNGWTGVTLFFVISAFTLSYTLKEKSLEKRPLLFFYIRRAFRILPLYYTWLFVMCIMIFGWDLMNGIWLNKKSLILYTFFGFNFFPGKQEGLVWASWTLGVEMVFYLFFPFIFRWCKNLKRAFVFFLITLFFSWVHYQLAYKIPNYDVGKAILNQLPVFAIGIICYYVFLIVEYKNKIKNVSFLIVICSLSLIVSLSYFPDLFGKIPLIYPMSILYGMLLIGLAVLPLKIIVNRVSVFFGLISYSLYLNHPQLISYMSYFYKLIYSYRLNAMISFILCVFATLIPLTIVSLMTYYLIEKPGMSLGRNIINRIKLKESARLKKSEVDITAFSNL